MKTHQLVTIHDHQAVTTSQTIAEHFGKPHYEVLKTIRRVAGQCPSDFSLGNFPESTYINERGQQQPCFELTRDAFTLVAMSFTGEKALQFKLAYIAAFNQMETALRQQGQAQVLASLDALHEREETLQAGIASLKDELLDTLRLQVALLTKPKRRVTPNRPITQHDIERMRTLASQGNSTDAIARQLRRSRATVHYALKGANAQGSTPQAGLFGEV